MTGLPFRGRLHAINHYFIFLFKINEKSVNSSIISWSCRLWDHPDWRTDALHPPVLGKNHLPGQNFLIYTWMFNTDRAFYIFFLCSLLTASATNPLTYSVTTFSSPGPNFSKKGRERQQVVWLLNVLPTWLFERKMLISCKNMDKTVTKSLTT